MDGKRKGGAEKTRIKKRKALEADAAKCVKLSSLFSKSSRKDDDESGKLA